MSQEIGSYTAWRDDAPGEDLSWILRMEGRVF